MKIVLVNKYYYLRGGAERYVFELKELLSNHGHMVIPFSMKHEKNEPSLFEEYFVSSEDYGERKGLLSSLKSAGRVIYSLEAKKRFEQLIRAERPDVVHINNIYHQISPSILDVCRKYRIPVVQTVHDYKLICPNYKLFANGRIDESCKGGHYYRDILNRSVRGSITAGALAAIEMYIHRGMQAYRRGVNVWISPSKFVAKKLVEYGMPRGRIKALYHFQKLDRIEPNFAVGDYLLFFGRLSEEKGVDIAIRAMQWIDARLRIVGDGPERDKLERLVDEMGVADRVEFVGYKSGEALAHEIRNAGLVLMPSVWYEVFGYSLVEALAYGKVVVGSRVGAITEILEGAGGRRSDRLLFAMGDPMDLADKVNWLLGHKRDMERIGLSGRRWVEKELNPESYYRGLMRVYMSVLRRR